MAAMKHKKPSKKPLLRAVRFRIMPLTVTMLTLLFGVKLVDLYTGSRALNEMLSVRNANAADAPDEKKDAAKPEEKKPEEKKDEAKPDDKKPAESKEAEKKPDDKKDEKSDAKIEGKDVKPADAKADDKNQDAKPEDKKEGDAKEGDKKDGEKKNAKPVEEERTQGAGKTTVKAIEELKAKQAAPQFSQTELDLLQNLVKRREEIEKREQEFEVKSKVLDATEKRLNDKVAEMKALQAELGKVVEQYNKHQDAEIRGLVKIYETMKPADAANIFNELDMPILLEVIDKMSERKVAPVLAGMNPKRARDVTEQLAELRRGRVKAQNNAEQSAAPAAK